MANITFFDDPLAQSPKDVKIKQLGLYIYPDSRRVAVGFDLTPFIERPCIEITITNKYGEPAGSLNVIEPNATNFSLTMHLRDKMPTDNYKLTATIYYQTPETDREDGFSKTVTFDATQPGEQIFS
ncbi:MAG: hypothetical protein AAF614_10840 [Chloroflexota bacterium]